MSNHFPLQTLLELMQSRKDDAARELARLIAKEQDAKSKLQMLMDYRDEYLARFLRASEDGLSPQSWRNYQEFLGKLDEAVKLQADAIALASRHTADGQQRWMDARNREKAIDTLSVRHEQAVEKRQLKQEQKEQDEHAAKSYRLASPPR